MYTNVANDVSNNGGDGGGNDGGGDDGGDDDGLSTAEILYTVFGSSGVLGLVVVIGSVVGWCLKCRRGRRNSDECDTPKPGNGNCLYN